MSANPDFVNHRHRVPFPRRVLTMKHMITWLDQLLIFLVLAGLYAGATTCVSNKKFKVKMACGTVTDPTGVPIPKVDIELLDIHVSLMSRKNTRGQARSRERALPGQDL
jgi:hypothetical protein